MTGRVPAPSFTLVLATYGRSDILAPMLASLRAQTCRDFELIVVDQNPDDRVAPMLAGLVADGIAVDHCRLSKPNLSAARNLGIARARGRIVAFPDDDCWYEPDCLAEVAKACAAHEDVAGWVIRWVETEPGGPRPVHRLDAEAFRRFRSGDASSISLFLDTAALRRLDGFDPRFGVGRYYGAGEETDLVMRILDAGLAIEHLPTARVHHLYDSAVPKLSGAGLRNRRRRERGVGAMYAKHRLPLPVVLRGLSAPFVKGVASARPLSGVVFALATVAGRIEGMARWRLTEAFGHGRLDTPAAGETSTPVEKPEPGDKPDASEKPGSGEPAEPVETAARAAGAEPVRGVDAG